MTSWTPLSLDQHNAIGKWALGAGSSNRIEIDYCANPVGQPLTVVNVHVDVSGATVLTLPMEELPCQHSVMLIRCVGPACSICPDFESLPGRGKDEGAAQDGSARNRRRSLRAMLGLYRKGS